MNSHIPCLAAAVSLLAVSALAQDAPATRNSTVTNTPRSMMRGMEPGSRDGASTNAMDQTNSLARPLNARPGQPETRMGADRASEIDSRARDGNQNGPLNSTGGRLNSSGNNSLGGNSGIDANGSIGGNTAVGRDGSIGGNSSGGDMTDDRTDASGAAGNQAQGSQAPTAR